MLVPYGLIWIKRDVTKSVCSGHFNRLIFCAVVFMHGWCINQGVFRQEPVTDFCASLPRSVRAAQ